MGGFRSRSLLALVALWVTFSGVAAPRAQQEVVLKRGRFIEEKRSLSVTVGFREMFSRKLRARLKSGFPTTVVMRVYLYRKKGGRPIAFSARTLRVVYDLWEERYLIRIQDHRGNSHMKLKDQGKVIDKLSSLWRFPIADLALVQPLSQYFVAVIAEVNPMSKELLAEVRRWLRNPHGGHRQVTGESFFGSFVSLFVNNKIRRAEKTYRIRTQPFFRR